MNSRVMKHYPKTKEHDEIIATAASVEKLYVLVVEFNCKKDGKLVRVRAQTKFKAYEDKPGIFISFENFEVLDKPFGTAVKDKDITKVKTGVYEYDEEKFCDLVYEAVISKRDIVSYEPLLAVRNAAAVAVIPAALGKAGFEIC